MAVRVLSIDGGGIRGIIPATVLIALEQLTGRRTYELFDGMVGTSTGGILTLALTCPQADAQPQPAARIRSLYLDRGPQIFPLGGIPMVGRPRGWKEALLGVRSPLPADPTARERAEHFMGFENTRRLGAVTGGAGTQGNARYPAEPLEAELRSQFGDTLMSQALRPVAVVSCDLDRADPLIFVGGGIGKVISAKRTCGTSHAPHPQARRSFRPCSTPTRPR